MKSFIIALLSAGFATALHDSNTAVVDNTNVDIVSMDVPYGYGANGTLKVETEKATQYLYDQAGIDINKFLAYFEQLPRPEGGAEYTFPEDSGLEDSHVTFNLSNEGFPVGNEAPGVENVDCNKCWIACTALSWFPPAWVM